MLYSYHARGRFVKYRPTISKILIEDSYSGIITIGQIIFETLKTVMHIFRHAKDTHLFVLAPDIYDYIGYQL